MVWPTDSTIDQTFPDNNEGQITALVMRNFQKSLSDAGRASILYDPVEYGAPTDGISPASAGIQAAIDRAAADGGGVVWIARRYAIDTPVVVKKGVNLLGNAHFNRRVFPNDYNGNVLVPHAALSTRELVQIGTTGGQNTNPVGSMIEGVCFSGISTGGSTIADMVGVYIRDTSDVYFRRCQFGNFDRTDNTGFGVIVEGTGNGNCFGTIMDNCVFSNCQHGVMYSGLGTTDMRHSNNLYVGCTRALSIGYDDRSGSTNNLGGAGMQIVNDHFTYTGMPNTGWFIRSGSQGGTLMCSNVYFDQHGDAFPVRLGNAKAKFVGCHFLMAAAQDENGLIRIGTAGSQETVVVGNTVDLNGSALQSLVHWAAGAGRPNNITVMGNNVYGAGSAWVGHVTDNTMATYGPVDDGQTYIAGNTRRG